MRTEKVIIGMSGGVDSSVAAFLLKEQGYEVIGVNLQLLNDDAISCGGIDPSKDAKAVTDVLQLPLHVIDYKEIFNKKVSDYFISSYLNGYTPNPCIQCNRHVKWEALLEFGKKLGASYVATGHYASIHQLENGRYALQKASSQKDQTYALYKLTQEQLAHTLMPLGNYTKEDIRKIASKIALPIADKPDSQDICFVPDGDYTGYIERQVNHVIEVGNFIDTKGTILGKHKGIIHYTIGQRKGLGLPLGYPAYVIEIRKETNEVVIGSIEDVKARIVYAANLNFMAIEDIEKPLRAFAKIRYNHKGAWCLLEKTGEDQLKCTFDEPQKGITKGQSLVFYEKDFVLGGGTIIGGDK